MLYNFCKIREDTEVAARYPYKNEDALVIIEQADEFLGFKTLNIEALTLRVEKNEGFTELEVEFYKDFISKNLSLIFEMFEDRGDLIA
ncbi:MAG: hypothetical protein LBM02_06690 [Lachnospiraceae bacterium]|jgi:hypothetical protein|nr:hypothetical protein [Lachnospiraceae bacterium]